MLGRAEHGLNLGGVFSGIIGKMPALKLNHPFLLFVIFLFAFVPGACSRENGAVIASPTPVRLTETLPPPTETPVPLAATVNGESITLDEFTAELERYKAAQAALAIPVIEEQARQIVLEDLILQVLLAQGAAEAGFTVDDSALQARIETLSAQVGGADSLQAWMQAKGYSESEFRVTLRRAIAAAWMRDKIISSVSYTAQQVHVRQILLYNEDVAKNYYEQWKAGADFDELAIRVDPVTRGDIGWFPRHYLASREVEEAAFSLPVGGVSEIIQSEAGYHIIKVLETQAERPLSPDALLTLQNRAVNDWLAQRRQQSAITITIK
ncbi:MAG: peptidylprolyl isomerase [Anaerolineales bacterium]